tara:strand:+ start:1787 stop:3610 length:1824 start_codon:yes stop_codon:yes gene_type:complete
MSKNIHVASVTTNIKGRERTVELGKHTLIVGPNGSGKSGIVNAVELALTGTVSDIAGRASVTQTADLMSLAPGRKGTLESRVELSDGSCASWRTEGTEGRAKAPERVHVDGISDATVLPLRAVREALLGSPDTARRFILGHAIGTELTDNEIMQLLPGDLQDRYVGLAAVTPGTAQEKLLAIQKQCGSEKRRCSSEMKGAEKLAGRLGDGAAMPPTESELEAAKQRVDEAEQAYTLAQAEAHNANNEDERARLQNAIQQLNGQLQVLQHEAGNIPPVTPVEPARADPHRGVKLALGELLAFQSKLGADDCLVCGERVGIDHLREREASITAQLQAAVIAQQMHEAALRRAQELAQAHLLAQNRIDQVLASIQRFQAGLASLPPVGRQGDTQALYHAQMTAIRAREAFGDMKTKLSIWGQVQQARIQVRDLELEAVSWKALEKECKRVVRDLVSKSIDAFASKVQSYLPKSDEFQIQVKDGSRDVFRVGLVHDGVLHTALSGAEWARVTAALAGACIPADAPLAVVIPEDRAWDGATLAATMRAFSKLPAQVIIASTTKPKGKAPKGWTVIATDSIREAAPATDEATPESATNGTPPLNIADFLGADQ